MKLKAGTRRAPVRVGVLTLALSAVVAGCSDDSDPAETGGGGGDGDTLRVAYQVIPNGAPIVKHEGWLEEALDVEVEWSQFDAGADVNRAVASGSVDVGLVGTTLVANGVASGLEYEVAWIYDVIGDNEALVVRGDSGISSIADLVGKKVATPLGSTTQYSLVAALEAEGVDPSEVSILDMKPPDALAAWQRGDIDAAYIWHPTLQQMIDDGGEVLVTSGDLAQQGILTADVAIVSKAYGENNPEIVAEWLRQEHRAAELIKSDPDQAAEIIADEFGISPDDISGQLSELIILDGNEQLGADYLGTSDEPGRLTEVLASTAQFLGDQEIISSVPDAQAYVDVVNPSYLEAALED